MDLGRSQKAKVVKTAYMVIAAICDSFCPGQCLELLDAVIKKRRGERDKLQQEVQAQLYREQQGESMGHNQPPLNEPGGGNGSHRRPPISSSSSSSRGVKPSPPPPLDSEYDPSWSHNPGFLQSRSGRGGDRPPSSYYEGEASSSSRGARNDYGEDDSSIGFMYSLSKSAKPRPPRPEPPKRSPTSFPQLLLRDGQTYDHDPRDGSQMVIPSRASQLSSPPPGSLHTTFPGYGARAEHPEPLLLPPPPQQQQGSSDPSHSQAAMILQQLRDQRRR